MTSTTGRVVNSQPGYLPADNSQPPSRRFRFNEWLDGHARQLFITPAVVMILIFSIFPLVASLIIAFSRVRLKAGGYQVRFVGFQNFSKQIFGSEQFHFLGTFTSLTFLGWAVALSATGAILWWMFRYITTGFSVVGFIGRLITALVILGISWMFAATFFSGNPFGTLGVTLFYVFIGCAIQFIIGLALAFLCSQPIRGRNFFRVVFFIPMMITPIGVGYLFRMMADTTKGPFSPAWQWFGLNDFAWAANPWTARLFIIIGDSWQWIPFIFIILLAAFENIPRDYVEAGQVDGASNWQIFREISWPQVMPVAVTVMLIRVIEGFKIVDLPNIMTSGGPGIATESMSLHSLFAWRSLDLGQSAAIAYLLLFVTVVICVSFFNLIVVNRMRRI
ncbi:MAG: sugar ABC transporter permease [Alphaproteobacteria bacterium]|nr:sugar ABC transporter permease [Alphaproteobacteria bacterium]